MELWEGKNLSFHARVCFGSLFAYRVFFKGCWKEFLFPFWTFIIKMPWEKERETSELWRFRFSPPGFLTSRCLLPHQERKLYAKAVSTFKFIFPFTFHRHVYYIDFDIIANIFETMMYFLLHLRSFLPFVCFPEQSVLSWKQNSRHFYVFSL